MQLVSEFARQNKPASPAEMLLRQKARAVPVERFGAGGPRLQDSYPVGVLHHVEREEYTAAYEEVIRRARGD